MSWENNLLDASFAGLTFDCLATDDEFNRSAALHSYPYKDGAEVEDMGGDPQNISITAIFFGDDYDARLIDFISGINKQKQGDLIHPVFGLIKAQLLGTQVHHEAEMVDYAQVALRFVRILDDQPLFNKQLPKQKAEAVQQSVSVARQVAAEVLADQVESIKSTNDFNRIEQLRVTMNEALNQAKTQVSEYVSSGLDVIDFSRSWASDLSGAVTAIVDLRDFDVDTLMADWKGVFDAMDNLVLLPTLPRQPSEDRAIITSYLSLEQLSGKAESISLVLASEAEEPTMSALEIEEFVSVARQDIQASIEEYKSIFGIDGSRPVTEPLKDLGLSIQDAAQVIIEARPPLVKKTVGDIGNYRLIAHKLYGDHTRAIELFRLNPQFKAPNFISQGDEINAYAR